MLCVVYRRRPTVTDCHVTLSNLPKHEIRKLPTLVQVFKDTVYEDQRDVLKCDLVFTNTRPSPITINALTMTL